MTIFWLLWICCMPLTIKLLKDAWSKDSNGKPKNLETWEKVFIPIHAVISGPVGPIIGFVSR